MGGTTYNFKTGAVLVLQLLTQGYRSLIQLAKKRFK